MQLTLHSSRHGEIEKIWPSLRGPGILAQTQKVLLLPTRKRKPCSCPRAYIETPDPLYDFFNKVRGSLPIIGLLTRILSDDGGIGSDRIQFKEFCTRVYRNFTFETTQAFFDFEERHGSAARPQYVLLWCWAAALGAGLLKSEDMMMGANRLRATFDIYYEEENLNILMDEAIKKRQKLKSKVPFVPYEARAEKALDAICKCCISKSYGDEEDADLLITILQGVFPAGDKEEIERCVRQKVCKEEEKSSEISEEEKDRDADVNETSIPGERFELLNEQQDMLNTVQPEEKSSSLV